MGPQPVSQTVDYWIPRSAAKRQGRSQDSSKHKRREKTGDLPGPECRVSAAQLHKEPVLQVQGRLFKERCWLVVDSHSSAMRSLNGFRRGGKWPKEKKTQEDPEKEGHLGDSHFRQ